LMERMGVRWRFGPPSIWVSTPHVHDYDEYFVVLQGCYTLIIDGKRVPVRAGEEYFTPKGTWHGGEPVAGTRTIHAFGGRRTERVRRLNSRISN